LNAHPNVFIVLNHPYWDAESIGAIELNGMRSRRENREVLQLGEDLDVPVVSGGDRQSRARRAAMNLCMKCDTKSGARSC
jgi:hypothetical protein